MPPASVGRVWSRVATSGSCCSATSRASTRNGRLRGGPPNRTLTALHQGRASESVQDCLMTSPDIAGKANGYVLNVAQPRRTVLLDARDWGSAVAESVPDFTHPRSHPLICFVSFSDGAITHLAEGRRGHRGGTGLRRLNLLNLTRLGTPVPYEAVLPILPLRLRIHVETRFANGGLLPPSSFGAVVDAVRTLLPEANRLLERFSESRRRLIADLSGKACTSLAYQKETVATALTLAGIERQELLDWRPPRPEQPSSVLP